MTRTSRSVTTLVPPMVIQERLARRDQQHAVVTLWYDTVTEMHFVTAYEPGRHFRVQAIEAQRSAARTAFDATAQMYVKAGFTLGPADLSTQRRERLSKHLTDHHAFREQRNQTTM